MKTFNKEKLYIITQIKGFQYSFEKYKTYIIENLNILLNKEIFLNKILYFSNKNRLYLGTPYLKNIKIKIKIINHFNKPKIITYKIKPKKGFRKKSGNLKKQTKIMITGIFIKK